MLHIEPEETEVWKVHSTRMFLYFLWSIGINITGDSKALPNVRWVLRHFCCAAVFFFLWSFYLWYYSYLYINKY